MTYTIPNWALGWGIGILVVLTLMASLNFIPLPSW